jgi:hypothetical protein
MGWFAVPQIGSLTWAMGAALLTASICPRETEGSTSLHVELICWGLILMLIELTPLLHISVWKDSSAISTTPHTRLLWLAAASTGAIALSSSFGDTTWIIVSLKMLSC